MYVYLLDRGGRVLVDKNLPANPEAFLEGVAPDRDALVVECIFTWRADLCAAKAIVFVLCHALYTGAIRDGKMKNDRIYALKIAMTGGALSLPLSTSRLGCLRLCFSPEPGDNGPSRSTP